MLKRLGAVAALALVAALPVFLLKPAATAPALHQAPPALRASDLAPVHDALVKAVADRTIPGASLVIVHRGKVVLDEACGDIKAGPRTATTTPDASFGTSAAAQDLASRRGASAWSTWAWVDADREVLGLFCASAPAPKAQPVLAQLKDRLRAIVPAAAKAAAPDAAARVPGGGLEAHEAAPGKNGGHTLERHVGKSDDFLRQRLATEPNISGASTFTDRATAEWAVAEALRRNEARIEAWLQSGEQRFVFDADLDRPVGRYLTRSMSQPKTVSGVRVVLVRDATRPAGYLILTAYP